MKYSYKYLAIIILCGFLTPFCSMVNDEPICSFPNLPFIDIQGIALFDVYQDRDRFRINNAVDTTFEFRRDRDVVLPLEYLVDYVVYTKPASSGWSETFTPKLMACLPYWGYDGSKEERHAGVTVTTILPYSPSYPAGAMINDVVLVGDHPSRVINSPLDSLVRDTSLIQGQRLSLLIPSPATADTMQLRIELNLSTGEMYELTTPRFVYTR